MGRDLADLLERYQRLALAAAVVPCLDDRSLLPPPPSPDDEEYLDRHVNLAGPAMAILGLIEICGEALALFADPSPNSRQHERASSDTGPADPASALLALKHQTSRTRAIVNALADVALARNSGDATNDQVGGRSSVPSPLEADRSELAGHDPGYGWAAQARPSAVPGWHWIKAGTNPVYCAIIDGSVEAVVYRTEEEPGTDEAGEPIVQAPGWYWLGQTRPESRSSKPPAGTGLLPTARIRTKRSMWGRPSRMISEAR